MQDWHHNVGRELVAHTPARGQPEGEAAVEVAFGQVRAALVYVLELARAHRIVASGNVAGDDVWLLLGRGRVRFTLNRRDGHVVVRPRVGDGQVVRWDEGRKQLVDGTGAQVDLAATARLTLDALVSEWTLNPVLEAPSIPAPREFDDEPTKG